MNHLLINIIFKFRRCFLKWMIFPPKKRKSWKATVGYIIGLIMNNIKILNYIPLLI